MSKFGIGQPVARFEDERFVTGRSNFLDDLQMPGQLTAAVIYSTHAHARINAIETDEALQASGVVAVLTGSDATQDGLGQLHPWIMPPNVDRTIFAPASWPILCTDRVRFVGDRIALVIADSAAAAQAAAELVSIDYEPLPAIASLEEVADAEAAIHDSFPGNICFSMERKSADFDDLFSSAEHVVSVRVRNNRVSANPMEPRAALGLYDPGSERFTLYTSSQNPHGVRSSLARGVFRISENLLRVVSPDVGGGFGMKSAVFPEDALVLWAAKRSGRPVKWTATRSEALFGDTHGRDQIAEGELALDADGRILALRTRTSHAIGAYFATAVAAPVMTAMRLAPSLYDIKSLSICSEAVFTNTSPIGVYRGAGRPEATYLIERLLDRAAAQTGIDPVELRRRNLISEAALPYKTATGCTYDSGRFEQVMNHCLHAADWNGFAKRQTASMRRGMRRGRAFSSYIEESGVTNERMELRFDPSGSVTILAGTHSHGQGHATTYRQMAAEWLGIPIHNIHFVQGDTDLVAFGRGTYAARSSMLGGCALKAAADQILSKATRMAARQLEVPPEALTFTGGTFYARGTNRAITMTEVARAFYDVRSPIEFGVGLEAAGVYAADPPNFPCGAHACEIELDPETGCVEVDRYTVVDDVGTVINPLICHGQVHGGLAQGIGQALIEEISYEAGTGQLITGTFNDYAMPKATMMPDLSVSFDNTIAATNPLGIKGVGETGSVASPAVVINAILDALRPLGVDHIDMPATPHRIWSSILEARDRQKSAAARQQNSVAAVANNLGS